MPYYSDNLVKYYCDYGANLLYDGVSTKLFNDIFLCWKKEKKTIYLCLAHMSDAGVEQK